MQSVRVRRAAPYIAPYIKRHAFIAHALNLIVAGIVIKCSILLQIGICVR